MGCNESKHSVATDNAAISNTKKPNKRSHKNVVSPAESIPESAANATVEKESSPPAKQPELENLNTVTTKSSNNNIDEIAPKAMGTASDVKDISVNLNETTPTPNAIIIEEKKIEENLNNIVSQDQSSDRKDYLNSRKERGSIDSIVSDNDGYYSPHHELPTSREGRDDDHASEELD
ncbi:hypothetical protein Syun_028956 [Stephania yunnanensis]|uniref:Uncharacterized protein n=1 Tax=Stephania yunnanensis TaxID=152371 RepID=A0AAP0HJ07_9MAGN